MISYLPDILLILISACTCLYCAVLSRRLKKLQSLDGGLGASILELTQAIAETKNSALDARTSIQGSMNALEELLAKVEIALPQVEARLESLNRANQTALKRQQDLKTIIQKEVDPKLKQARLTSKTLLDIVRAIKELKARGKHPAKVTILNPTKPTQRSERKSA